MISDYEMTFLNWLMRDEDTIARDGSTLDDVAKTRLIISKLDASSLKPFLSISIAPKTFEVFE